MKRILAPVENVRSALYSLGIDEEKADWIIDLFECFMFLFLYTSQGIMAGERTLV